MADNLSDPGTDVDNGTAGYQTQVPIVKWDPVPGASGYDLLMVQYVGGACQWTTASVPRWSVRTAATAFTPTASDWNNVQPWPANGTSVTTDGTALVANTSYCVRVTPFRTPRVRAAARPDRRAGDPTYLDPTTTDPPRPSSSRACRPAPRAANRAPRATSATAISRPDHGVDRLCGSAVHLEAGR